MADGTIKPGGDPRGYLGHFRSEKVIKAGHNVGAPGVTTTPKAGGGPGYGYGGGMTTESGGGFGTPAPAIADAGGTMRPPGTTAPRSPNLADYARKTLGTKTVGQMQKQAARAGRKEARKSAFGDIRAQQKEVRRYGKGMGDVRKAERTKLQSMKKEAKKEFPQAYKARIAPKPKEEGGGFLSKLTGAFKKSTGIPATKKAGGKMMGQAKKMGGKMKKTVPGT